jgi:hypothetical protein
MKIQQHVDAALWPYLRRHWVYVVALLASFGGITGSILLSPVWGVADCVIATVAAIVVIDSRDRYLMWRSRPLRSR